MARVSCGESGISNGGWLPSDPSRAKCSKRKRSHSAARASAVAPRISARRPRSRSSAAASDMSLCPVPSRWPTMPIRSSFPDKAATSGSIFRTEASIASAAPAGPHESIDYSPNNKTRIELEHSKGTLRDGRDDVQESNRSGFNVLESKVVLEGLQRRDHILQALRGRASANIYRMRPLSAIVPNALPES